MSQLKLQQKREALQKEIEIAQHQLVQNINTFQINDIMPTTKMLIPQSIASAIDIPSISISNIEKVSNAVFPKSDFLNLSIKIIKLWNSLEHE